MGQQTISFEPFAFSIGGVGAVAVGCVSDEHRTRRGNDNEFADSTLRSISYALRCAVRFFAGGFVYVLMDTFLLRITKKRLPALAGAVTASCFANARTPVFLGSVLGMAIFCHFADMLGTPSR